MPWEDTREQFRSNFELPRQDPRVLLAESYHYGYRHLKRGGCDRTIEKKALT